MFLSYIHSFRALAILFIVAGHCEFLFEWEGLRWLDRLIKSTLQNGTVLFVFVAGFLFQHLSDRFEYRRYLRSKLRNVILPYLIVSTPMILLQWYTHRGTFSPEEGLSFSSPAYHIAWLYLTGKHIVPFWFIPMIAVFYLLAPWLLALDRDRRIYVTVPPLLVLSAFAHRPAELAHIWQSLVYFFPVYLFGMYLSHEKKKWMPLIDRSILPLTFLYLALVVLEVVILGRGGPITSQRLFSTEAGVFGTNLVQKVVLCVVLIAWLRRYEKAVQDKLATIAEYSFGIYFVHMYFISAYTAFVLGENFPPGSLLAYLALVAAVVVLSMVVLWVGKKILGRHSRWVFGC